MANDNSRGGFFGGANGPRADGSLSFMDSLRAGSAQPSQIDDAVEAWHAGAGEGQTLEDFLGMTPSEYPEWMRDPGVLEAIVSHSQPRVAGPRRRT